MKLEIAMGNLVRVNNIYILNNLWENQSFPVWWLVSEVSKIVLKCDDLSGSPSWHTPWRGRTLDHGRPCWDGSHSPVLHWLSRTTPVRRQQVYRSTQHRWLLAITPPATTSHRTDWLDWLSPDPARFWPTPNTVFIIDHCWWYWGEENRLQFCRYVTGLVDFLLATQLLITLYREQSSQPAASVTWYSACLPHYTNILY